MTGSNIERFWHICVPVMSLNCCFSDIFPLEDDTIWFDPVVPFLYFLYTFSVYQFNVAQSEKR